jgi:hypothetical protein
LNPGGASKGAAKQRKGPLVLLAGLILLAAFFVVIPSAEWGASVVYLSVTSVGMYLIYQLTIKRVDPAFPASLFVLAYLVKLLSCVARYWMVFDLYNGAADSQLYHTHGQILAQYFKVFDFSIMETYVVQGEGTTSLAYITGLLYTIMPASMAGAFFFFSVLAFAGTVLCYCAARVAWPQADLRYYTLCVFFLPSILFWPAALGKDAWILCWSGVAVWGWVSFIKRQQLLGLLWIALALLMLQLVRPHIAAFLALSIGAAYMLYSTTPGRRSFITWIVGAVAVAFLSYYMLQGGAEFLKLEDLSADSLEARIEEQQLRTTQGGSSYETVSIFTPAGFINGLITTAIRPFPWEASNGQMLITSLETVGWLVILWIQRRILWQKVRNVRYDPVAAFALCYTVAMLLALTSLGNFGIIARQRVMALPFLWMLFV